MTLPEIIPLELSSSNPGYIEKYKFDIKLAQKTGTNGPRDLFSAYNVDFFEKYASAYAKNITDTLVIGYDGSRVHESISISAREYLRRAGINVLQMDGPVTVPEFMYACYKSKNPGCFFGRSHSPQQYIGLKLVLNGKNILDLLEKNGAEIKIPKELKNEEIYGFLPRTLAPTIEKSIGEDPMVHPKDIGNSETISAKDMREEFFKSLKKVTPMKKIQGNYIMDCRHSMAGEVWKLIQSETDANITLHNNILDPIAPDRDPREIWDKLANTYYNQEKAVFSHDADADRTFLVKLPGIGYDKILENQEQSFAAGLISEAQLSKPEAYILVQERITITMLTTIKRFSDKIYATAQGEPAFFMGVNELMLQTPNLQHVSGADYTDIFFNRNHPICMKSPYQHAIWLMYWFSKNTLLPEFPETDLVKTEIDMIKLNYPQRLEKVLNSSEKIIDYFGKEYKIVFRSTLDGQNIILEDDKENKYVVSIRPSGTGRYTKVITEIGLGKTKGKERKELAQKVNNTIEKIID
ncbi:MAG: hypothetical protein ACFFDW_01145 [Candidatus Thorarchaeota archaeon]